MFTLLITVSFYFELSVPVYRWYSANINMNKLSLVGMPDACNYLTTTKARFVWFCHAIAILCVKYVFLVTNEFGNVLLQASIVFIASQQIRDVSNILVLGIIIIIIILYWVYVYIKTRSEIYAYFKYLPLFLHDLKKQRLSSKRQYISFWREVPHLLPAYKLKFKTALLNFNELECVIYQVFWCITATIKQFVLLGIFILSRTYFEFSSRIQLKQSAKINLSGNISFHSYW
jgi:cbb3-type cytochrome oxidase subunit 3